MTNTKTDGLYTMKRWVRTSDARRDHRRANEIGRSPGCNPGSRTKYRINVGDLGRTLAIEQDFLVLTDVNGGALIVKQ